MHGPSPRQGLPSAWLGPEPGLRPVSRLEPASGPGPWCPAFYLRSPFQGLELFGNPFLLRLQLLLTLLELDILLLKLFLALLQFGIRLLLLFLSLSQLVSRLPLLLILATQGLHRLASADSAVR